MNRFEWVSISLQIFTLGCASYFALVQNTVNDRLARLEDYVSVTVVPDGAGVTFINTGGSNVYIEDIDIDGNKIHYDKPRQIAAKAGSASTYFVPITLETANKEEFAIEMVMKDEFGDRWISKHGGGGADDGPTEGRFSVWTYRTERP